MQDPRVQRALLLLQQSRYDMAERELRGALADDPDESISHSLLAMCLLERQAYDEATSEAEQAIGLMPDQPMPHYAMAQVMRRRRRYADAERAIAEAIALDPFSSDYFAVQSAIYFDQRKWQAAKHAAEMGLSVDAEDVSCNNLRSMAMVKLGETADAFKSLEAALEREPENAYTHANLGWTKLEQGDPKSALNHFREALRLDPELDWARSGVVEALKARFFVYRWLLGYFLWMAKLSNRAQWAVVLGLYFGYRLVAAVARSSPELAPYLQPLVYIYIAFALLTWVAYPLFNLLLCLHPVGKYALTKEQRRSSYLVGLCLVIGLAFLGLGLARDDISFLMLALMCGLMMIPVAGTYQIPEGWPRNVMTAYTCVLAALAMLAIAVRFTPTPFQRLAMYPVYAVILGIFLGQFLINWLMGQTVRR
jgi:tetratricopeptide (TPR) repeat protein